MHKERFAMKELKEYIRNIPDFPEEGIIFRDVTSILQDADGLKLAIDELAKKLEGLEFDVIAGAESRGFLFGMPLAYLLHKPFVPIRKKGKLPCETVEKTYDLEYGTATIEIHKDAVQKGDKVVLLDDLIATGDLGWIGRNLLMELFKRGGVEMPDGKLIDCGNSLFSQEQDPHAGGSGCGCSASMMCGHFLKQVKSGELKRILYAATGALMSPTMVQQGGSIPGRSHAVEICYK